MGTIGEAFAGTDGRGAVWIFGPGLGGMSGTWVGDVGAVLLGGLLLV